MPFEKAGTWRIVERDFPWPAICLFLNTVTDELQSTHDSGESVSQLNEEYNEKKRYGPLPEDFALREQVYSMWYFPDDWFRITVIDSDERKHEMPSMVKLRMKRILWLGHGIASVCHIL